MMRAKRTKREEIILGVRLSLSCGIAVEDYRGHSIQDVHNLTGHSWEVCLRALDLLVELGIAKKVGKLYKAVLDEDCADCIYNDLLGKDLKIKEHALSHTLNDGE